MLLLSGQFISQVGDKFYLLAISYWALETTGSASMMGLVLFATLFPETIMSLVAGAVVDKYSRKWIIVWTDSLRGVIVLGLAYLFYLDRITLVWIITAQALLSLNTAFFNPCIPAVIPQIVDQEKLGKANAQTQLVRGISTVLGPALGGLCVATYGYLFVFLFNGISFLVSAWFELFLKIPAESTEQEQTSLIGDIREGFRFIIAHRQLLVLIASIAVIHFFVGAFQTTAPVLASFLDGNGAANLGAMQTAFGLGMVALSFVFGVLDLLKNREWVLLFGSIFLMGILFSSGGVLVQIGLMDVWFYLVPFLIFGGLILVAVTCFRTLIQVMVPNQMAGRVFGVAFSAGDVSIPLAMLIFGILLDQVSVDYVMGFAGIGLMIMTTILWRWMSNHQTAAGNDDR